MLALDTRLSVVKEVVLVPEVSNFRECEGVKGEREVEKGDVVDPMAVEPLRALGEVGVEVELVEEVVKVVRWYGVGKDVFIL